MLQLTVIDQWFIALDVDVPVGGHPRGHLGDPVGAAEHACKQLNDDGLLVIIEPFANDKLEDNLNIVGQMFYCASTMGCVPASLAQEVGLALGAQAGPARLTMVLQQAGFKKVEIVATTATNMVLCATK